MLDAVLGFINNQPKVEEKVEAKADTKPAKKDKAENLPAEEKKPKRKRVQNSEGEVQQKRLL